MSDPSEHSRAPHPWNTFRALFPSFDSDEHYCPRGFCGVSSVNEGTRHRKAQQISRRQFVRFGVLQLSSKAVVTVKWRLRRAASQPPDITRSAITTSPHPPDALEAWHLPRRISTTLTATFANFVDRRRHRPWTTICPLDTRTDRRCVTKWSGRQHKQRIGANKDCSARMIRWRATQGLPGALRTSRPLPALVFPASTRYHDLNPLMQTAANPPLNQTTTPPQATERERRMLLCDRDTLLPENRQRNRTTNRLQLAPQTQLSESSFPSHTTWSTSMCRGSRAMGST
jgi:hypothetical protein